MIRIITGSAKNTKLYTPDIPGFRSVQEVAKGSLFSILDQIVKESVCLDLYAGSGNLGLEALSRGAAWCDFVDDHKLAETAILNNIKKCGLEEKAEFHLKDAVKYAANTDKRYDLIFVDPFYENRSHVYLTKNLEEVLNPKGYITFFHDHDLDVENLIQDTDLTMTNQRRFGKSYFSILKRSK